MLGVVVALAKKKEAQKVDRVMLTGALRTHTFVIPQKYFILLCWLCCWCLKKFVRLFYDWSKMSRDEWSSITKNNNINSKEMKKKGKNNNFSFFLETSWPLSGIFIIVGLHHFTLYLNEKLPVADTWLHVKNIRNKSCCKIHSFL